MFLIHWPIPLLLLLALCDLIDMSLEWKGELHGFQTVGVEQRNYQKKNFRRKSDTKNMGMHMWGGVQLPDHSFPAEPLTMVFQGCR